MATTDNLDIELVSENALQLDPIINEALATIDSCLAGASTYDFESDANYTLTDEYFTAYLNFTDSGPVLTTGRDVIYPAAFPIQIVTNSTAEDLQLKVSGQTGITLTSGSTTMIYANGTDVVTYGAAGGFSNPMTTAGDLILGGASGAAGRLAIGSAGKSLRSNGTTASWGSGTVPIGIVVSDESTDLTTGSAKVTFRMPYAMTVTGVRASVNTAPVGSTIIVDINESGTSILSTKLSIDASEKTSTTAATAAVISDSSLADDAEITIDIDQIGSSTAGTGLKIWLIGYPT